MRNKDYFKTSILELLREKKKIGYSLTIIICTILMFSVLFFNDIVGKLIYSLINYELGYRTIDVIDNNIDGNYTIEEKTRHIKNDVNLIGKLNHIIDVFDSNEWNVNLKCNIKEKNASVTLYRGTENTLPNIIFGRSFKNSENGVAICPKYFVLNTDSFYVDKKNIMDGEKQIGTSFEVEYYDYVLDDFLRPVENKKYKKEFEIVGIYNNYERIEDANTCFVPPVDMNDIAFTINPYEDTSIPVISVVVDKVENVDKVIKELEQIGFEINGIKSYLDIKIMNTIKVSISIIFSIILTVIILTSASFVKKKIKLEEKDIGILRANGYSKKDIMIINVLKMIINNTILFIIGGIIFTIAALVIVRNVSLLLTLNIMLNGLMLSMKSFVLAFLFIVLFPTIILLLYMHKCLKNKIVCLIRSEE